jgi:hypothetical protein
MLILNVARESPADRRGPPPRTWKEDALIRYWNLANKYAGMVFTGSALFLLVPEGLALQLGLVPFRIAYRGYVLVALLASGAVIAGSLVEQSLPIIRRRAVWPLMKLAFPVRDSKTGLKQSRMRYYLVQLSLRDGKHRPAYLEVDSNGKKVRYTDRQGKTLMPADARQEDSMLNEGAFQFPAWGRLDWNDVLDGGAESGCWGIARPRRGGGRAP